MAASRSNPLRAAAALCAVAVAVATVYKYSLLFGWFSVDHLARWLTMARTHRWVIGLFYVVFAIAIMAFPITLFPIVGGVLCDFWFALPLNLAAAVTGAWLSYSVANRFGRSAIEPLLKGKLKSWDRLSGTNGFRTVALLRFLGVPPFIVQNYGLGLSRVSARDFILGTAVGILPWMTVVTYASNSLWVEVLTGGRRALARALFKAVAPLMALSFTTLTGISLRAAWKKRKATHRSVATHSNL